MRLRRRRPHRLRLHLQPEKPAEKPAEAAAAKPAAPKPAAPKTPAGPAYNLTVSVSPHAHSNESTRSIMLDVIIALLPALIGACVFFGMRSLMLCAVSCAACVFFEWAYRKVMKLDCTVGDLSAIVTAFCWPLSARLQRRHW